MQWISRIFRKCCNMISSISKKCWKFFVSKMLEIKYQHLTWVGPFVFSGFKNFPEDRAKLVTTTVIYTLNTYQNYMFFVLSTYVFAYLYRKLPPQRALNCCNPKCSQIGMKWDSLFEALFYFSVLLSACDIIIIYHHEKLSFIGVKFPEHYLKYS